MIISDSQVGRLGGGFYHHHPFLIRYLISGDCPRSVLKEYFFIKTEIKGKVVKIALDDLLYVEAAGNYIKLKSKGACYMAYLTMDEFMFRLPVPDFIRVHRSFIVKQTAIKYVEVGQVTLIDNSYIPVGRSYKERLLTEVRELLIESKRSIAGG
jgi:DNA-binding LytR/AlgR family response regulator